MPRGTLVVDEKLLRDHFLRQQRGGNITGYRVARFQRGYGIGGIFKSLARYAIPLFKQSAKVVGKRASQAATEIGQDVLRGKNVRESVKTHGGDVVKDFAEQGEKALLQYIKQGAEAREGKANAVIYQLQIGENFVLIYQSQDISNGLRFIVVAASIFRDSETSQKSDDIY
jgi:hypothetical protein